MIFEVIDFDPEKIEIKGGARFLAFSIFKCFYDDAMTERLLNHYANRTLIVSCTITPKSRAKVCAQWEMSLSPRYLATDRSKAVIVV